MSARYRVLAPFGFVAFALILVGCGTATPDESGTKSAKVVDPATVVEDALSQAEDGGLESQVSLLSDGAVTLDDYKKSVENYIVCVTEQGFEVDGPMLNPADNQLLLMQVYDGETTNEASANADTNCRAKHVDLVERAYRTLTEPRMDPALVQETYRCLDNANLEYTGDESKFEDFFPVGAEDPDRLQAVSTCVSESLFKNYPDIPLVALGF